MLGSRETLFFLRIYNLVSSDNIGIRSLFCKGCVHFSLLSYILRSNTQNWSKSNYFKVSFVFNKFMHIEMQIVEIRIQFGYTSKISQSWLLQSKLLALQGKV